MDNVNSSTNILLSDVKAFDMVFYSNLKPQTFEKYRPVNYHLQYIEYGLLAMIGINLIGLGGQIHGQTLFKLIENPWLLTTGVICKLALLPSLLLGFSKLLHNDSESTLSSLCLILSPSEGSSCLLALLAEADIDLCFALVAFSAFTTTAVTPLWAILFEHELYNFAGKLVIPFSQMFLFTFLVILAGYLGYIFCQKWPDIYDVFWSYLPLFSIITLLCILASEIYSNYEIFVHLSILNTVLAFLVSISGFLLGASVGYFLCQSKERIITLMLDLGVKTSYITNICVVMSYKESDRAKTAPCLCCFLTFISASVCVIIYRFKLKMKEFNVLE